MTNYETQRALSQHDNNLINKATESYQPKKVGETWNGQDVVAGDKIIELWDGSVVLADRNSLNRFMTNWLKEATQGDLEDLLESYFDGYAKKAGE